MGSDCIHSDGQQAALHTREDVIHAEMIRAGIHAARFFDQQQQRGQALCTPSSPSLAQPVRALGDSVRWAASEDTEGGAE